MNRGAFTSDGEAAAESAVFEPILDEELDRITASSEDDGAFGRAGRGGVWKLDLERPAAPNRDGGAVRAEILRQHRVLRGLLRRALGQTTVDLREGGTDSAGLGLVLSEVARRFREHLELEEGTLVPALRAADAWGPARVDRLLDEHERQRREIDTVLRGLAEGWDRKQLAVSLRSLVTDFLVDMAEEEAGALAVLGDDGFAKDQMTG